MSNQYTTALVKSKEEKDYITSMKVMKSKKDRLARQGYHGETLDDILGRVLDFVEKKGGVRK